jgi:septation ring formation regulator EzrA
MPRLTPHQHQTITRKLHAEAEALQQLRSRCQLLADEICTIRQQYEETTLAMDVEHAKQVRARMEPGLNELTGLLAQIREEIRQREKVHAEAEQMLLARSAPVAPRKPTTRDYTIECLLIGVLLIVLYFLFH